MPPQASRPRRPIFPLSFSCSVCPVYWAQILCLSNTSLSLSHTHTLSLCLSVCLSLSLSLSVAHTLTPNLVHRSAPRESQASPKRRPSPCACVAPRLWLRSPPSSAQERSQLTGDSRHESGGLTCLVFSVDTSVQVSSLTHCADIELSISIIQWECRPVRSPVRTCTAVHAGYA